MHISLNTFRRIAPSLVKPASCFGSSKRYKAGCQFLSTSSLTVWQQHRHVFCIFRCCADVQQGVMLRIHVWHPCSSLVHTILTCTCLHENIIDDWGSNPWGCFKFWCTVSLVRQLQWFRSHSNGNCFVSGLRYLPDKSLKRQWHPLRSKIQSKAKWHVSNMITFVKFRKARQETAEQCVECNNASRS